MKKIRKNKIMGEIAEISILSNTSSLYSSSDSASLDDSSSIALIKNDK